MGYDVRGQIRIKRASTSLFNSNDRVGSGAHQLAFLRLTWTREPGSEPVPPGALSHCRNQQNQQEFPEHLAALHAHRSSPDPAIFHRWDNCSCHLLHHYLNFKRIKRGDRTGPILNSLRVTPPTSRLRSALKHTNDVNTTADKHRLTVSSGPRLVFGALTINMSPLS